MVTTIIGKRRQGKSTLSLALAVNDYQTVVVFDPNDQFVDGFTRVTVGTLHAALLATVEYRERNPEADTVFMLRVGPFEGDEIADKFREFSEVMWLWEEVSIIFDEVSLLQGPQSINPSLDRWMRRTPANVSVFQTTHRLVDLNTLTRSQSDQWFFFQTVLVRELDAISKQLESGDRVSALLPSLDRHQVVRYRIVQGHQAQIDVWRDGSVWYIDLGNKNQERA